MTETCAICRGTGFELRTDDAGVTTAVRCACSFDDRARALLKAARIPRRYDHCSFESFNPQDETQLSALAVARDWVQLWPDRMEHGLLLHGHPGTGKTHLAVAAARDLATRAGARIVFYEQRELLKDLQETFDGRSGRTEAEVLDPLLEAEILVLDDLGAGRTTPWARDVLHDIIAHRYNSRLPMLITSNRPVEPIPAPRGADASLREELSLQERLGEALVSRLHEMCRIVELRGPDFRKDILNANLRGF